MKEHQKWRKKEREGKRLEVSEKEKSKMKGDRKSE